MFLRFVSVFLIAYAANLVSVLIVAREDAYLAQVVGMGVYTLVGFLGFRWLVFGRPGIVRAVGRRSSPGVRLLLPWIVVPFVRMSASLPIRTTR